MESKQNWMQRAIELSKENVAKGGGPFGAIIVRNGQIVGEGVNRVTASNDPTAHAEVEAIRNACKNLQTFELADCEIYTSCEPCPMCLSAIYWSHISKIFYGNTKQDAANINFDDDFIYQEIPKAPQERKIPMFQLSRSEALKAFELWTEKTDKITY
jgi:tRNA(Arg) A34 adenosine deaminase TadA